MIPSRPAYLVALLSQTANNVLNSDVHFVTLVFCCTWADVFRRAHNIFINPMKDAPDALLLVWNALDSVFATLVLLGTFSTKINVL
jgi:hypothetical protein